MKKITLTTRESYKEDGLRDITPIEVDMYINEAIGKCSNKLTKEDIWGDGGYNRETKQDRGMRIAVYDEKCPIFGDVVPYKSVTIICAKSQEHDVVYWLEYVYGGECVSERKELDDLRVALRADYQCW